MKLLLAMALLTTLAAPRYEIETFPTPGGHKVQITLIKHGSLAINYEGFWIQIDPVTEHGKHTDYASEFPKADVILVTHEHGDHLDPAAIAALSGPGTSVYLNQWGWAQLGSGEVLQNGDARQLRGDVKLEAVPAYNTTAGREHFHPKGHGNGYLLTIDGLRIYVAGDTEDIPEMEDLSDIDIAFLPVNQPYTMTVDQCVRAARMIAPKVLIPYHFSGTDLSKLPSRLPGVKVLLRKMQ